VWGAAALAVKAYALWREGRRLAGHRELWEYKSIVADEVGGWGQGVLVRRILNTHLPLRGLVR